MTDEKHDTPQDHVQDAQLVDWYVNELANTQNRLARAEVSVVQLRRKVQTLETVLAATQPPTQPPTPEG